MVLATDLEGFERAYRRRSVAHADDGLLRQIFGEDGLSTISKDQPSLLETARSYFPHLTSLTYERLAREPDTLQVEKDRCEREMEQLAVQNYGAFISNAKVTQSVRSELADIQKTLGGMSCALAPMQDKIQAFQTQAAEVGNRRGALRNVLQQLNAINDLLELPQLLDACIRNQMYNESLELMAYCGTLLQVHEARGEDVPVLSKLREQVAVQRSNLHASLVAQLKADIHVPECVRVIGFLRRIQRHSEEELRALFIEHRGSFLEGHKLQVEVLRASRASVLSALRSAADLLRTHVYDIAMQYKVIFQQDDATLSSWLSEQIIWFTSILRAHLLPSRSGGVAAAGQAPRGAGSTGAKIDAASLNQILNKVLHASSTLRRVGGQFFPGVVGIFEACMEQHVCAMLDESLLTLHAEMGRYDWVPSTALAGNAAGAAGGDSKSLGGTQWLHPRALELTRHRPLAVFANDMVQMFNELRQCALHGLRVPVVAHCAECLTAAVGVLRSAQSSPVLKAGGPKAAEFLRLCQHFAQILLPLVTAHLEAVYGQVARLDVGAVISSMAPDLLPEAEATAGLGNAAVCEAAKSNDSADGARAGAAVAAADSEAGMEMGTSAIASASVGAVSGAAAASFPEQPEVEGECQAVAPTISTAAALQEGQP